MEHKISWHMPGHIGQVCYVGKDVLAFHDNINIYFYNVNDYSESIYSATSEELGLGVGCISGINFSHKFNDMFIFAEMTTTPRIFLLTFPKFEQMCVMKDDDVEGYLAVGMTDLEQIVTLSGYPNYQISVWNWRTVKKLIACETSIRSPNFIFSWYMSQTLIFHGWNDQFYLWEIIPCYKICTSITRKLVRKVPKIADVTWSSEGGLFCVDKFSVYQLVNDGMGIIAIKEWTSDFPYGGIPRIVCHKDALLVYGPGEKLHYLTKSNKEWVECWTQKTDGPIKKLVAGSPGQILCITHLGIISRVYIDDKEAQVTTVLYWQPNIKFVEILKPSGNTVVSLNEQNLVCLWSKDGYLLDRLKLGNDIFAMECSPVSPYVALCASSISNSYGVWIVSVQGSKFSTVCCELLTEDQLMYVAWSESGEELVTCCYETGQVFFLKFNGSRIDVIQLFQVPYLIFDCFLFHPSYDMHFMALTSYYDEKINAFIKCVSCYVLKYAELVPVSGNIDPSVTKIVYSEKHLISMSHLSKLVQLYTVKLENDIIKIALKKTVDLGHDIAGISIKCENGGVASWGMDGFIIFYSSLVDSVIKHKVRAKHYLSERVRDVLFDPKMRFVISISYEGTLSLHNLIKIKESIDSTKKSHVPEVTDVDDAFESISFNWIDRRDFKIAEEETKKWAKQRSAIFEDFSRLQDKLVDLLEENFVAPPLHQLPINAFNLHIEGQQHRAKEAAMEREAVRVELEAVIQSQHTVADWVKVHCWDPMNILERKIFAIFRSDFVENYPLPAEDSSTKDMRLIIQKFRQFESYNSENVFTPWIPKIVKKEPVAAVDASEESMKSDEGIKDEFEEAAVKPRIDSADKFMYQMTGTSSHKYITPVAYSYPQLLTQTNLQTKLQAHCIEDNIRMLKLWFNKQFDNMMESKQKELSMIEERDKRLNFIISELNILSKLKGSDEFIDIYISDPQWSIYEIPDRIITIDEDEVGITPYISPSQIVIPPPDLGPKDDFKERALIIMMDGVLEKLWHEEIKKPIPMPDCMLKETIIYTEDDLKEIFKYEKNVEFRNEEREQYNKMLRAEYVRLSSSINETITRFNQKIKEFHILKLKVESAIGQEELKLMRLRTAHLTRMERFEEILKLNHNTELTEIEMENTQKRLQDVGAQTTDCHTSYDALMARDKALDKNFKSSFSDSSSIIADLCYKYFKKRPKWQPKAIMTAGVLYEMAQACVTKEKPRFLPTECIDFLKALDQLDLVSNMPAAINNETAWNNMCKLRRMKVELEMKIKAVLTEMAEVETATNIWNKRLNSLKFTSQKITSDLVQIRHDIEDSTRNLPLQLVMKYGYVEVELTGHEDDFKPAVLIKMADIDAINAKILEAGYMKLKAMRATTNFKKNILTMEWEHAKLKMKIRHLEQDIYHLERLKITKEIRTFLQAKLKTVDEGESNIAVARQVEITHKNFQNHLKIYMERVEEMEIKVGSIKNQIRLLEKTIETLRVRTSEKHLSEDPNAHKKQAEACKKRMETLVLRAKLLGEVKKQYIAIVLLQTELELQRLRTYPTLTAAV